MERTGFAGLAPYTLTEELDRDFALNQPLSPFALAFLTLLDPDSETYTLDVISTFEAILDDPRQLLQAQQNAERGEEIEALKADGVTIPSAWPSSRMSPTRCRSKTS